MSAPLRIAYVTPYDDAYVSISSHTAQRIAAWRERGVIVDTFVVGRGGRGGRGALMNLWQDLADRGPLARRIRDSQPDLVYMRWLTPVPGLNRRLRSVAPLILEVHADDQEEVGARSPLRSLFTRLFRRAELRAASGATFVISELDDSASFSGIVGPRIVAPNGSWIERRPLPKVGQPLVGISVGSMNEWTGVDRFVALAAQLRSDARWVVVCPPGAAPAVREVVGEEVELVVAADEEAYRDEISRWTVAIGTMALERSGRRTATPLKVRDYLGRGVPTVLPYWDESVSGLGDPLVLALAGPHDSPVAEIDPAVVRDFIRRANGRNVSMATSNAVAGAAIEDRRVAFLRELGKVSG